MLITNDIVRNVTGAEIEHFRQYGFVLLKRMIAPCALKRLDAAIEEAIATISTSAAHCDLTQLAEAAMRHARTEVEKCANGEGPFSPAVLGDALRRSAARPLEEIPKAGAPRGHSLIDQFVSERVPALRKFALHDDLPRLAAAFLDIRAVRFFDDILCVRQAGAIERTAFHQDLSYLHLDGDRGCSFWMFLDPAREGAGALGYVPGSHRWGHLFKPNFLISEIACPGSEGTELPNIESEPEAFGVQYIETEPGDIVAHHFLTVHGKQGNRSPHPCRSFALRYVDAQTRIRRRPGLGMPPVYRRPMCDGDLLDNRIHPLAWSAPMG